MRQAAIELMTLILERSKRPRQFRHPLATALNFLCAAAFGLGRLWLFRQAGRRTGRALSVNLVLHQVAVIRIERSQRGIDTTRSIFHYAGQTP